MAKPNLRVKIYGSRGSYSPTFSKSTTVGVNTTCLRVDIGENIIIFDAGSGIINCGQDLLKELQAERASQPQWEMHLFFTHMHIDHLVGFPYFPMLYVPKTKIHFLSPQILDYRLEDVLRQFMHPPYFPVSMDELPFERYFYQVLEGNIVYFYTNNFKIYSVSETAEDGWLGKISCMRNFMHPKGGAYFYKIETRAGDKVVFASDTEGFVGGDQRLIKFADGADILMHDAQYHPAEYGRMQGFGHSTYEMACDVARNAGVKKLLLIHHDPKYGDKKLKEIEQQARKLFPKTFVATESMEFTF